MAEANPAYVMKNVYIVDARAKIHSNVNGKINGRPFSVPTNGLIELITNNLKTEEVGSNVAPFLRNIGYRADVKE